MKKAIWIVFIIVCLGAGMGAWLAFGSATKFQDDRKLVFLYDQYNVEKDMMTQLSGTEGIKCPTLFNFLAKRLGIWAKLKNGRYVLNNGESMLQILRDLRNNKQAPARLIINKIRTREDLAGLIGKEFSIDSTHAMIYLSSNDSLAQVGADTNTVMSDVIPDTYELKWNSTMTKILSRLKDYSDEFWAKNDRKEKAEKLGLSPLQVYTLASIVEEETNAKDEKGNIASVYYNRFKTGMRLGADPTVKFALHNFELKRIMSNDLKVESPYNTYKINGLPPGPICTPSKKTIDAVLNMPTTDYLYFVADSKMNGKHVFSKTYQEHLSYANQYHQKLDSIK